MKRYLLVAVGAVAGYLLLLVLVGFVLDGYVQRKVRDRLSDSLQADVEIGEASVSLLRGKVSLRGLKIERNRGGTILIEVDSVDANIARLGWSMFDNEPRSVAVRGMRITLSGRGAWALRDRESEPMRVRELLIEDATVSIMPTTLLPNLGRLDLRVERARTGPVVLGSGVSWIFELEELDASADLAGHVNLGVGFADEELTLTGGLFGSRAITVGFTLPEPDPNALEGRQLLQLAKQLAKALVTDVAKGWFDRQIRDRFKDLVD